MKKYLFYGLAGLALTACMSDSETLADADQYLVTNVGEDTYTVVYVQMQPVSDAEAKNQAMKRAAQVAHDKGYRYFVVNNEENVTVLRSPDQSMPPPENLYQNMIQQKNFGKNQPELDNAASAQSYPGLRLTFQCYTSNPPQKAVDVCSLIPCQ